MPGGRTRVYAGPLRPGEKTASVPRKRSVKAKALKAASSKVFNAKVEKSLTQLHIIERKSKTVTFPTASTKGTGLESTTASVPQVVRGIYVSNVFEHVQLTRGPDNDEFTGNKISDVSLRFSGVAVSNQYDATNNNSTAPMEVWFVFYKNKAGIEAKGNPNGIKQYPGNTTGKIDTVFTSTYPWNKNEYTIKGVKKFKLRARPKELADDDGVINGQTSNAPTFHRFNYKLPVAKMLKYGDSETKPSNDYLSMGIYIIDGYGGTLTPAQQRCAIYGSYTISFTDA